MAQTPHKSATDVGQPQGGQIQLQVIQNQPLSLNQQVPPHVTPSSISIGQPMGTKPTVAVCKICKYDIVTRIEKKPTTQTHVFAGLLCLFLCWPCVCIPYCMPSCNNVNHYCPNCGTYIGSYHNYLL